MCGKLSSVGIVVGRLKDAGCFNWAVTEFVQGAKTRRWGVAWSWSGWRPAVRVARGINGRALRGAATTATTGAEAAKQSQKNREKEEPERLDGGFLPFPSEFVFEIALPSPQRHSQGGVVAEKEEEGEEAVARRLNTELRNLDLQWQWKATSRMGLGIAAEGDCWSRKARRRKEQQIRLKRDGGDGNEDAVMHEGSDEESEDEEEDEGKEPELVFKIQIQIQRSPTTDKEKPEEQAHEKEDDRGVVVIVTIRWLRGQDHVLFESFCGWLKRKLGSGI